GALFHNSSGIHHHHLLGDRQRAACFYSEFAEVTA
ncbi:hypothetical protein, partial [Klebsiella pneumoniae]